MDNRKRNDAAAQVAAANARSGSEVTTAVAAQEQSFVAPGNASVVLAQHMRCPSIVTRK
jgi:hypothetical protein